MVWAVAGPRTGRAGSQNLCLCSLSLIGRSVGPFLTGDQHRPCSERRARLWSQDLKIEASPPGRLRRRHPTQTRPSSHGSQSEWGGRPPPSWCLP